MGGITLIGDDSKKTLYKSIVGQPNLYISKFGVLYNIDTKEFISKTHILKDYRYIKHGVVGLTGRRHRLIAMAWLDVPENYEELIVNHLDGVKWHDYPSNLEWTTQKRNVEHAIEEGLTPTNTVYIRRGDDITRYTGYRPAAESIGVSKTRWSELLAKYTFYYPNADVVVSLDKDALVSKLNYTTEELLTWGAYIFYDKATGKSLGTYPSIRAICDSNLVTMSRKVISRRMRAEGGLWHPAYIMKVKLGGQIWDLPPTKSTSVSRAVSCPVYVYDVNTGKTVCFKDKVSLGEIGINRSRAADYCGRDILSIVVPHHRVSYQSNINWPEIITLAEIRVVASPILKSPDGELTYLAKWDGLTHEVERLGLMKRNTIRANAARGYERILESGYSVFFLLGDIYWGIDDKLEAYRIGPNI